MHPNELTRVSDEMRSALHISSRRHMPMSMQGDAPTVIRGGVRIELGVRRLGEQCTTPEAVRADVPHSFTLAMIQCLPASSAELHCRRLYHFREGRADAYAGGRAVA
jgi:hypothetical protein